MTTTICNGRFGNQFIRNLAVSFVAEKHNLCVNYSNKHLMDQIGLILFSGDNTYNDIVNLTDDNYFTILNQETLQSNLDAKYDFFQTKNIINFLYNHIRGDLLKNSIINKNPFSNRYNTNNDLYVHIRLGDVESRNPGVTYYINTIAAINYDNLYISTDDKTHIIIKEIIEKYQNTEILEYDEIETIQFASTCKHIVLSHGTFSSTIGYLAFFSNINFPKYNTEYNWWHGDIFSIDGWNGIYVENFSDLPMDK